jgi:iron complex outermembrane recepter protein
MKTRELVPLGCSLLLAAGAQAASSADAASDNELQEVVVTARFRSESLQTAPIAITAVTGAELESRGFQNITQVSAMAPNVSIEPGGSGSGKLAIVSIRGVGQGDFKYTFEPGVAFYQDGVYWGTAFGSIFDLGDVASVEILRGPQGTLFGKNTEGGAIVVQSTKPTGSDSGYVEAGYGSYQRVRVKGAFDFALIPGQLFARISAGTNTSNGYQQVIDFACANPSQSGKLKATTFINGCKLGTYGGDNVQTAKIALRWTPTDNFEANLQANVLNDHGEEPANSLLAINLPPNANPLAGPTVSTQLGLFNQRLQALYGVQLDSRFLTHNPFVTYGTYYDPITGVQGPTSSTLYSWGTGLTMDWTTPWDGVHVKSITGYSRYHGAWALDASGAPVTQNMPINYASHRQLSEELQVSGKLLADALEWTAGVYYLDSHEFNSGIVDQPSNVGGKGILFLTGDPAKSRDESAFVHANYKISDRWNLEVGARYSHQTKDYEFYRFLPVLAGTVPTLAPPLGPLFPPNIAGGFLAGFSPPPDVGTSISRMDPKVGLSYTFMPDVMGYIQYSTGYKSGGFNPRPLSRAQVTSFGPEKLNAYELGLKSEWFDHRLRANVAVFDSEYHDLQLPVATVDAAGIPAFLTEGVGHARIQGVEIEVAARPVAGLSIDANLGYLNYKAIDLGGAAFDAVKNANGPFYSSYPSLTPRWKGGLGAQYVLQLGSSGKLTPRLDLTYQSIVYNDPQNWAISAQPGYALLNGALTWQAASGLWEATLRGTNLTDKVYYSVIGNGLSTYNDVVGTPGRPREFLLTVRRNF